MTVEETIAFFGRGEERHKSYPVVRPDGRLVGLVSRGDVLRGTRGGWNAEDTLASCAPWWRRPIPTKLPARYGEGAAFLAAALRGLMQR